MPTKAELEHQLRRAERALSQALLDLRELPSTSAEHITPPARPMVMEALERAEQEWERVVVDPCNRVNSYIQSRDGIGWTWEEPYVRNGQFAWCGAFAAFVHHTVKFPIRHKIFPSCYRLYQAWANTSRKIAADEMRAGDIVVVFTSKRSVQGDHITIATSSLIDGEFSTIEGNAHGTLGNNEYGEGVVKNNRSLDQVAHVYRLLDEDYDE